MQPLGPLFDSELSQDEAMEVFRARRAAGTADEGMFLGIRGIVLHLETLNGTTEDTSRALLAHLDTHPPNQRITNHLDAAHDTNVRQRFVRGLGGVGAAIVVGLGSVLGVAFVTLQITQLVRNW